MRQLPLPALSLCLTLARSPTAAIPELQQNLHRTHSAKTQRVLESVRDCLIQMPGILPVVALQHLFAKAALVWLEAPFLPVLVDIAGDDALVACLRSSNIIHWPGQLPQNALHNATVEKTCFLQPFYGFDIDCLTDLPWFSQQATWYHCNAARCQLADAASNGDWAAQYAMVECARTFGLEIDLELPCLNATTLEQLNPATLRVAMALLYNQGGDWEELAPNEVFYRVVLPGLTGLDVKLTSTDTFPDVLASYRPVVAAMQERLCADRIAALEAVTDPWPRDMLLAYLKVAGGNYATAIACLETHIEKQVSAADTCLHWLLEWGRSQPKVLDDAFRRKCERCLAALRALKHTRYYELVAEVHVLFNEAAEAYLALAQGDALSCIPHQLSLIDSFGTKDIGCTATEHRELQATLKSVRATAQDMFQQSLSCAAVAGTCFDNWDYLIALD